MNNMVQLEEALTLALRLSPKQRIQLIERIASSVESEIEPEPKSALLSDEHWGQNLLQLLDELGPIELAHPEIEDPTEWVQTMGRESRQRRLGNWDTTNGNTDSSK